MTVIITDTHLICCQQAGGQAVLRKEDVHAVSYVPNGSADSVVMRVIGKYGSHVDVLTWRQTAERVVAWFTGVSAIPESILTVIDFDARHDAYQAFTTARVAPAPDGGHNGEEQET